MERGIFKPSPTDVLEVLDELTQRIDRFCAEATGTDVDVARAQRAYAALMGLRYRQFLQAGASAE
ncbi:hypothetical protein [Actinacidiphila glaucinigra]|uniref:hypothetical protein n=1 Tax=Actinacidiphila glaucinigra TaxID=235986 RepID=UPI003711C6F5